ncbi:MULTISPECIES: hypothetical protein [Pseudoalteromonas]|uniref:Peptidase S8/S53 domain-containing protein n=1 Tax=Pseudoalteromonas amylolytica TaxID=1859457 RepID=A0A1S1MQY6_9GAMM|nr:MULTISPECIES: hypothetical protein [Pseudoalteromonas]OHU86990.1 hypothetical protein BFC16_13060 [Pseudoalteromonas sp. JW3]OHU88301.1 hypothetical protein BET10_19700 [Pseudoalteromonas amylolytica]
MKRLILSSLVVTSLCGCGGGDDAVAPTNNDTSKPDIVTPDEPTPAPEPNPEPNPEPEPEPDVIPPTSADRLVEQQGILFPKYPVLEQDKNIVEEVSKIVTESTCNGLPNSCDLVEVVFEPKPFNADKFDENQRILVIDYGLAKQAISAYRDRVLDLMSFDAQLNLVPYRPVFEVPKDAQTVFEKVSGAEQSLSAINFSMISADFASKFLPLINEKGAPFSLGDGHGAHVAAFLFEYNPKAQLLLVEDKHWMTSSACDALASDDENLVKQELDNMTSKQDSALAGLQEAVKQHKIRFINASFGVSKQVLEETVAAKCGSVLTESVMSSLMALEHRYIEKLATMTYITEQNETRQPLLVQAGIPKASHSLSEDDVNFPIDCDSDISPRLRVANPLTSMKSLGIESVPVEGVSDNSKLSIDDYNIWMCSDVYIPTGGYKDNGIKNRTRAFPMTLYGVLTAGPIYSVFHSSSFSTPIAVSALNYIQTRAEQPMSAQQLIEAFVGYEKKILDPLQHDLFNVYKTQVSN